MEFEFDLEKSQLNFEKHGIDFRRAQALWDDPRALVVEARSIDEVRFAMVARLGNKTWTCIFTIRNDRIRIISTRRARDEEKERYDQG